MEAHRQPGMLAGLSRFLVQHERCGAGFDVAHPAGLGSGRVSITCRGCGARHEYATATIELEREVRIEPAEPTRRAEPPAEAERPAREPPAPIPPRPAPYPDTVRRPSRAMPPPDERRAAEAPAQRPRVRAPRELPPGESALRRFSRSPYTILALVVIAASALGFGVVRLINESGESDNAPTQPAPSLPPAAAPTPEPTGPVASPVPGAEQPQTVPLRTERFTLEVPQGWRERTTPGGLLLEPRRGGRVNVQIFFERSPGLSSVRMAQQTTDFLTREVPGASLFPNRVQIAGLPAYELTARGPGETAIAVNVLRGPYRYLLVRRIFAGAKPRTSQAGGRIVLSFRPR